MASLSIAALISFFAEEKKSIERGENHYRSEHIESFSYHQGILRGEVQASMKKKVYRVTVVMICKKPSGHQRLLFLSYVTLNCYVTFWTGYVITSDYSRVSSRVTRVKHYNK